MRNSPPARMSPHSSLTKSPPYISNYMEANGVDTSGLSPDGLTAFVLAYQEATGGALTTGAHP